MARILVIDDDESIRNVLSRFLQRSRHDVVVASSGKAAMIVLRESSVDLVITDVLMPDMDGIEVLLELRRLRPELPVIVMSGGYSTDKHVLLDTALLFSATATIAKPFDFAALQAMIERMVPVP